MIDPKTNASVLQAPQQAAPCAAEISEMQTQRLSFVLRSLNQPTQSRMHEALAVLEDRRMAARKRISSELNRLDRTH
jgi:hypothetical protein